MGTLFRSDTPRQPPMGAADTPTPADPAGDLVPKIEDALEAVDRATLDAGEAGTARYGASSAELGLRYKRSFLAPPTR